MIRTLLRDGAIYAAASIASRALGLLLLPVYARVFAPAEYGTLDLITTLALLVSMVVALEVVQGLARLWNDAADDAQRARLASTALGFSIAGHALFLLAAWITAPWVAVRMLDDATLTSVWRAGAAFIAVQGVAMLLQQQFRWELRPRAYAIASVGHALGLAACGLGAAVGLGGGLEGLLWGQAVAALVSAVLCALALRTSFSARPAREALRAMLAFSVPLVPAGIAAFASFYANRFLLAGLGTLDDVGVFGVALRIAGVIALLIVGVQGALTPLIYAHHAQPETPAALARAFEAFVGIALPACLALGLFAPELIGLLATPEYASAAPLVIWLAPAVLLTQMYVFAPGLAIAKRTGTQLVISLAAATVGVAGNALLIGPLGGLGAAIATFVAAVVYFGSWLAASQRLYRLPLRAGALIGACAMTAVLAFAASGHTVLRAVCVLIALAAAFALGLIRRDDLRQLAAMARS